jgi:prepilin-type N-terminal cleavage/methylation domain-containing protein
VRATAIRNNKGMTLVEVLVALLISLLVFLALMQTALVSIDANMRNVLRDEAVKVAEMRMNMVRSSLYETVLSDPNSMSGCSSDCPSDFYTQVSGKGECISKDVRSFTGFNYCTNVTCLELGGDGDCSTGDAENKQVTITVGWKWKDEDYTHRISTIKRRI